MAMVPNLLFVSGGAHWAAVDRPLLHRLAPCGRLAYWQYQAEADGEHSLEVALVLLHDYLKGLPQPVHLVGHGMGGVLAWYYAAAYPERVRSLALLAVGANPAVDWQAHYYHLRQLWPCEQAMALNQLTRMLFAVPGRGFASVLAEDLMWGVSLHSLWRRGRMSPPAFAGPIFVGVGGEDIVVSPPQWQRWRQSLKPGDRFWICAEGRHFFHYEHPALVAPQLAAFWHEQDPTIAQLPAPLAAG
jgi:pimeloyl-ACP methyl ester carboxylesterase